jgi:hypothetical protein
LANLNVLPNLAEDNAVNRLDGNSVSPRRLSLRHAECNLSSQGDYIFISEFAGLHPPAFRLPSFTDHVFHVVVKSADKQVAVVDTKPDIASVQNLKTVRDWTVCQFPREPMRFDRLAKSPVTMSALLTCPNHAPILIRKAHIEDKMLKHGERLAVILAVVGAEHTLGARVRSEDSSASLARTNTIKRRHGGLQKVRRCLGRVSGFNADSLALLYATTPPK